MSDPDPRCGFYGSPILGAVGRSRGGCTLGHVYRETGRALRNPSGVATAAAALPQRKRAPFSQSDVMAEAVQWRLENVREENNATERSRAVFEAALRSLFLSPLFCRRPSVPGVVKLPSLLPLSPLPLPLLLPHSSGGGSFIPSAISYLNPKYGGRSSLAQGRRMPHSLPLVPSLILRTRRPRASSLFWVWLRSGS